MGKFYAPWRYSMEDLVEVLCQIAMARVPWQEERAKEIALSLCGAPDRRGWYWATLTPAQVVEIAHDFSREIGHM